MASSHTVDPDWLVGRSIGRRYQIRELIGQGAFAAVFRADQHTLGRTVAIKVLYPEHSADPNVIERFHEEARAASRLNHPHTVSTIDFGQTGDGLLYLVMEDLRGVTLTRVLAEQAPLDASYVAEVITQVLSGLDEAHDAGVIHADLKPDNIIVEHRRGDVMAKVVDFGIARIVGSGLAEHTKRPLCGTPEYMAPELASGAPVSVASDIYAMGVTLYELLSGVTPFGGGEPVEILRRHVEEAPVHPSRRRPDLVINQDLERAALRALAKSARDRFASAGEFRQAVAAALTARRPALSREELFCPGCGVVSPTSFKFCPECGLPRDIQRITRPPTSPPGLRFDRRRTDEGGLFPFPLLGREQEQARLADFLRGASPDNGCVLQVVGAYGSGRTHLLRDALANLAAAGEGPVSYATMPDPSGLAAPFYPIRAMVAAILALPPVCSYEALTEAIGRRDLSRRDVPGIGALFDHEGELRQLEPPVRKRELFSAALRVLRSAANQVPALLLFEDADRYDHPSQELLRRLLEGEFTESGPRIVVTSEPAFADRWLTSLPRIDLGPLSLQALAALGERLAEHAPPPSPEPSLLLDLTGGLAVHVYHIARHLLEGGKLDPMPRSLGDLITFRLQALPSPALTLCQVAAIFGYEVARDVLAQAADERLDKDDLAAALAVLTERGILVENTKQSVVAFAHSLVRDLAYSTIRADVREALHQSAVIALRAVVTSASELGHHSERAGNLADAAEFLQRAGNDAVRQFDDLGACRLYDRALRAARTLVLTENKAGCRSRLVALAVQLSETLRVGGEVGVARGVLEEAETFSQGEPALEAQRLRARANLTLAEGNTEAAAADVRRAIGLSLPNGQLDLIADLYLDLAAIHLRAGNATVATAELREGVDVVTMGEGARADFGPAAMWRLLLRLAQLCESLGNSAAAHESAMAALQHARRVRSRLGSARVQIMLASHFEKMGNLPQAERYRHAAIAELRRLGDRRGTAELLLGSIDPANRSPRIAETTLREARELAREVGWLEGVRRATPPGY